MKKIVSLLFVLTAIAVAGTSVLAQETDEKVIDEVVAQVNEGVITLSRIKREAKAIVETDVQQGKSRAEAEKMVAEREGELIVNLINEELLVQKAKELGLEQDIETSLNQRFVQIMKQYNMRTLDELYREMEKQGVNPEDMRSVWRKQATREEVLRREVMSKEYWRPGSKELRDYFEKHKAQFTKPETVSVSELFIGFAGRDENAVRQKAKDLLRQLRSGVDFAKIVTENSDRPDAATTKGKVPQPLTFGELDPKYAAVLKPLKAGEYTEPVEDETGITILRVDERSAASSESVFNENAVRMALVQEKAPEAQKKFMSSLRQDAYIKINDTYRPVVSPILFADERQTKKDDN